MSIAVSIFNLPPDPLPEPGTPQPPALEGEVWRGAAGVGDEVLAVAVYDGAPIVMRLDASRGWVAASGSREVYALRDAFMAERARADALEASAALRRREPSAFAGCGSATCAAVPREGGHATGCACDWSELRRVLRAERARADAAERHVAALLADADDTAARPPPALPLPAPPRSVMVRGLRFTRRDADWLAEVLTRCRAEGIEPGEVLREARMALARDGL